MRSGVGVPAATPEEGVRVRIPGEGGVGVGGGGAAGVGEGVAVTRGTGVRVGVGIDGLVSGAVRGATVLVTGGPEESPPSSNARVAAVIATASEMAA